MRSEDPWRPIFCQRRSQKGIIGMVMNQGSFPWASYQISKIAGAHAPGMLGTCSPTADFKGNR